MFIKQDNIYPVRLTVSLRIQLAKILIGRFIGRRHSFLFTLNGSET